LIGSRPTLLERNAEALELFQFETNFDTQLEPAARDDIDYRDILRETHRIVKGHQEHSGCDADTLRAGSDAAATGRIDGRYPSSMK
jgi:hypothetical protein